MAPKALELATEERAAQDTDEALALRSGAGDKDAFAELYERHYESIYDFAVRILREPEAAADVVQATFTRAWPALREGTHPTSAKAWLFGIARNLSIDELRRRRRVFPNEGLGLGLAELPDPAAFDPSEAVETKELAELVWTSAAGLRAEEYALLDLHVRRGLSADELADSLGVRRGAVYTRLTRLRAALERAVATSLLLRHGRGRCPELDRLAASPRQAPGGATRRSLEAHVEDCERCQESKGLYASPAQILAGLALVPPPEELEAAWALVGAGIAGAGAVAASGKASGLAGVLSQSPVPVGVAAGGFATLATVVALGVWAVAGDEGTKAATPRSPSPQAAAPAPAAQPPTVVKRSKLRQRARPSARAEQARNAPRQGVGGAEAAWSAAAGEDSTGPPREVLAPPPPAATRPPAAPARPPAPSPPGTAPQPAPSPSPTPPASPPPASPPPASPPPPAPQPPAPPAPSPPPPPTPPPPPPAAETKVAMCLNGNTLLVPEAAVAGLLRAGATLGACSILEGGPAV